MAGNSFGQVFRITTFGESHGVALGAIIDGCPPGLSLSEADIQKDLDRRKPGQSKYTTQRREPDRVQILSGVFEGKTTGTPIGLKIDNEDQRSKDYSEIKDVFRPAHADFTYEKKYGIRDYRGGGRSSARETAMRVACGAVAKKYLGERLGIQVYGFLSQIGDIQPKYVDSTAINENPFFCADPSAVESIAELIDSLRREGDSIGAEVTVMATGMPIGLGEPVFDKLDSDLASALMSINAVKGVNIGSGMNSAQLTGEQNSDEITQKGRKTNFKSNNAGGILGGISSGQEIVISFAVKPTSSILSSRKTIDKFGKNTSISVRGRHDPCVGIRAVPIGEAMMHCVLLDHYLMNAAQCKS